MKEKYLNKKTALVLGGGGFIGGHLAKRLKDEGFWVRIVDIKEKHEYWDHNDICNEYIQGDLRDPLLVSRIMFAPNQTSEKDNINSYRILSSINSLINYR